MRTPLSLALTAAIAFGAAACNKPGSEQAASTASEAAAPSAPKPMPAELPDVLARVNGQEVRKDEFQALIDNMERTQGPIPSERRDEVLREALDHLITRTLLEQEAKARNIAVPDADVEGQIDKMRSRFPSEDEFKKALESRRTTVEQLRTDARTDMVITRMLDAEVASAEPATDEEARAFYAKNPEKFTQPEAVRASHILLLVDEKADEATRKKLRGQMDGILKRARAGEDFAALAKAHSQDGSAAQGGDLGFFTRGRMVPPFEQAAFALEPGALSDVVTTQFGYHVIKLIERRAPATVPLEKVSPQVKEYLTGQKKQDRADTFIAGLKKKSRIEVLI